MPKSPTKIIKIERILKIKTVVYFARNRLKKLLASSFSRSKISGEYLNNPTPSRIIIIL